MLLSDSVSVAKKAREAGVGRGRTFLGTDINRRYSLGK